MSPVSGPEATIREVFATVDAMDIEANAKLMADDVELRFANADPVIGKEAFIAASREFLATLKGIRHVIDSLWVIDEETVVVELTTHYTRHDGGEVSVPAADIFRLRDGLVADYRIFVDITPAFA